MHFFDSHFHLDLWKNPSQLLADIEQNKIYTIAVTNAPSVFQQTLAMTKTSTYVRASVGLHPELVNERHREVSSFRECANMTRYIGEIGLDYVKADPVNKQLQRNVLNEIMDICYSSGNKILTLHSRKAEEDVLSVLGNKFPGTPILHWYSGPKRIISKAIEVGCYFSINLAMTLSKNGQEIIKALPEERLLTESDGPFVMRDGVPCSPLDIPEVVVNLSKIKKIDPEHMKSMIYDNLKHILK